MFHDILLLPRREYGASDRAFEKVGLTVKAAMWFWNVSLLIFQGEVTSLWWVNKLFSTIFETKVFVRDDMRTISCTNRLEHHDRTWSRFWSLIRTKVLDVMTMQFLCYRNATRWHHLTNKRVVIFYNHLRRDLERRSNEDIKLHNGIAMNSRTSASKKPTRLKVLQLCRFKTKWCAPEPCDWYWNNTTEKRDI